jgi:hypothetical protein
MPPGRFLRDRQFTLLVAVMSVAAMVITVAYGIAHGGFPQPSELQRGAVVGVGTPRALASRASRRLTR